MLNGHNPDLSKNNSAEPAESVEHLFESMFKNAPDAMLIEDDHAIFLDVNPAACELFGVSKQQIIGTCLSDAIVPGYDFKAAWNGFLAHGKYRGRRWLVRPDGKRRLVESSATANFVPGKHFAIWRDVTDEYFLEMRLSQSEKNEALGRLACGIAHDFTNALSVIGGHAELIILESSGSVPVLRRSESILQATKQAAELATQLYAFSRQQVLSPAIVNLNDLLDQLAKPLRSVVGEGIQIEIRKTLLIDKVKVDRTHMSRVILTLAGSARDALAQGGKLLFETSALSLSESMSSFGLEIPAGDYVALSVSDDAPPMSERDRRRLFDPFSGEAVRGSGLAMAAVYGLVQQSGGYLCVDSSPEQGNVFKILLPSEKKISAQAVVEEASKKNLQGTETILLAEDEPALREATREYLTCLGYHVLHACNGVEALEIAHANPKIDLVITDLVMPKMSGKEFVFQLCAERPETKVIFISGYPYDVMTQAPTLKKEISLVHKPFSMRGLATKVREVLGELPRSMAQTAH